MIERKMMIGCIVSTDFLKQVSNIWDPTLLETREAKRITAWCWEYFNKYDKAPGKEIESIFNAKMKTGKIPKDIAEMLEEEILPGLSKEFKEEEFNLEYVLEESQKFFKEHKLLKMAGDIVALVESGESIEAERLAIEYKPTFNGTKEDLDLSDPIALERVNKAFTTSNECLIHYPYHLGEFWNNQLVRGGFVALMGPEKRGKTFWLLDMALRASKDGKRVAFFQAGDMTEGQQLVRLCIYLTKKSNLERYAGPIWEATKDCVRNQMNTCTKRMRSCNIGVFEHKTFNEVRHSLTQEDLIKAHQDNPEYVSCAHHKCGEYKTQKIGAPWVKLVDVGPALESFEAQASVAKFFLQTNRKFKLSTHANGTLSIRQMKAQLAIWESQDDFIPDVIIVDYADLLTGDTKEFRHLQNEIWKGLRALSQEKGQPLVITATQADAKSYDQDRLTTSNFSEDKRKYAHVTAMFGLNQDTKFREKKIGLMRINELVIREGEFITSNEITVVQNLKRGRPFIGSYW